MELTLSIESEHWGDEGEVFHLTDLKDFVRTMESLGANGRITVSRYEGTFPCVRLIYEVR